MKKVICFLVAVLLVIGFNCLGIFGVSLATERYDKKAIEKGSFDEIMLTETSSIKHEYYNLLNWGYGDDYTDPSEVVNLLNNTTYTKATYFEQVIVRTLQNRFNSVIMLWLDPADPEINKRSDEFRKQNDGCGYNLYCIKLMGQYYMIIDYYRYNSEWPSTAVYKAEDSGAIEKIDVYKSVGEYYDSYSFYPLELAQYVSLPFSKILNVLYVVGQSLVVYNFLYYAKEYSKKELLRKLLKTLGALVLICVLYFLCENIFSYIYCLPSKPMAP